MTRNDYLLPHEAGRPSARLAEDHLTMDEGRPAQGVTTFGGHRLIERAFVEQYMASVEARG